MSFKLLVKILVLLSDLHRKQGPCDGSDCIVTVHWIDQIIRCFQTQTGLSCMHANDRYQLYMYDIKNLTFSADPPHTCTKCGNVGCLYYEFPISNHNEMQILMDTGWSTTQLDLTGIQLSSWGLLQLSEEGLV